MAASAHARYAPGLRHLRYILPALLLVLVLAWLLWPRPTRLDDMSTDARSALFRLPYVVQVERTGPTRPVRRVVHILDYHTVPDDLARVVEAWPMLPPHIRAAVLALVGTTRPA